MLSRARSSDHDADSDTNDGSSDLHSQSAGLTRVTHSANECFDPLTCTGPGERISLGSRDMSAEGGPMGPVNSNNKEWRRSQSASILPIAGPPKREVTLSDLDHTSCSVSRT